MCEKEVRRVRRVRRVTESSGCSGQSKKKKGKERVRNPEKEVRIPDWPGLTGPKAPGPPGEKTIGRYLGHHQSLLRKNPIGFDYNAG